MCATYYPIIHILPDFAFFQKLDHLTLSASGGMDDLVIHLNCHFPPFQKLDPLSKEEQKGRLKHDLLLSGMEMAEADYPFPNGHGIVPTKDM